MILCTVLVSGGENWSREFIVVAPSVKEVQEKMKSFLEENATKLGLSRSFVFGKMFEEVSEGIFAS